MTLIINSLGIVKNIFEDALHYGLCTKMKNSMIRKYHNHKLQINPSQREEEPHNNHEMPGRQTKQSNQLSLPHQDDGKTKMYIKLHTTKHRAITDSPNGSNNKQRQQQ